MSIMHETKLITVFLTITLLSGITLASTKASADAEVIDQVSLTIPIACTMTGEGTSHTATLDPGTYSGATSSEYENGIGKTTLTAICNDDNGFSIYAIGYTGNSYDSENHTKLVGSTTGGTIATKAYASGDTTSNWSMKLTKITDSAESYNPQNLTISTGYDTWHAIPADYTKVAEYHASTGSSTTDTTLGVKLKTTYAAFIASNQAADTYKGQVKYTMVHPYNAAEPVLPSKIGVTYDADGSTFTGGASTNRVVYDIAPMYIATTPLIAKSSNVTNDGTKTTAYASDANDLIPITAAGAVKMKVVVNYSVSSGTGFLVIPEAWNGEGSPSTYETISDGSQNTSGTETYVFDGDSVTIYMRNFAGSAPITDYDYGFWAQVYPVYTTEQTGTEPSTEFGTMSVNEGTYAQTTDWYGSWYVDYNNRHYDFTNESEVMTFLGDNTSTLNGTNITLYRGLTINEAYAKANKTQSSGYYIQQDMDNSLCQTVAIGQNETVKDSRDGNTYMIGKLKDGRCWMLNNLALDPTDATTAANLSSTNTNATTEAITNYLNGGSSNTGWSNIAVANVTSSDFGDNGYTIPQINNQSKNTLVTSYGPASSNGQAKVGIYYNYCATTVGTYCYDDQSGDNMGVNASQDICPANWRIPTGRNSGEYGALYSKYNATTDATNLNSLQYNLSATLSGTYRHGTVSGQNNYGVWLSATCVLRYEMSILEVYSYYVNISSSGDRTYGHPVRCIVSN